MQKAIDTHMRDILEKLEKGISLCSVVPTTMHIKVKVERHGVCKYQIKRKLNNLNLKFKSK